MKTIQIRTLALASVMVCNACFTYRTLTTEAEFEKRSGKKSIDVLRVQTKEGLVYHFNREYPAKIIGGMVTGIPQTVVGYREADSIIFRKKNVVAIWKKGFRYPLIQKDSTGFVILMTQPVIVPFTDISQLDFKKYQPHLTGLIVFGAQATVTFILLFCVEPITDFFFGFG